MTPHRVAIAGASGLVGSAVAARLRGLGHEVSRLVRSREAAAAPDALYWRPGSGEIETDRLKHHHVVINFAGENIFGLWTRGKKERIRRSRIDGTTLLASTIANMAESDRPGLLIVASAVGYYGDQPWTEPLTEDRPPGDTFLARVLVDMEAATAPASRAGVRVVFPRLAPVLDPEAFLLRAISLATRFGLGAALGPGRQPFPWVTRAEIAHFVPFVMDRHDLEGPVNVVAPQSVSNADFADAVARVLNRPRFLRIPTPLIRLLGDLGNELLVGQNVVPEKLEAAGYSWRDPDLERALRGMLG